MATSTRCGSDGESRRPHSAGGTASCTPIGGRPALKHSLVAYVDMLATTEWSTNLTNASLRKHIEAADGLSELVHSGFFDRERQQLVAFSDSIAVAVPVSEDSRAVADAARRQADAVGEYRRRVRHDRGRQSSSSSIPQTTTPSSTTCCFSRPKRHSTAEVETHRAVVTKQLATLRKRSRQWVKWRWAATYHNWFVDHYGLDPALVVAGVVRVPSRRCRGRCLCVRSSRRTQVIARSSGDLHHRHHAVGDNARAPRSCAGTRRITYLHAT